VIEQLAQEYGERIAFVAVAWKSSFEQTAARAAALIPSGKVRWGLDEAEEVFSLYGIPYQPASVFIRDGRVVAMWLGARGEEDTRSVLEALLG
jgi:hypothetical protein